MTAHAVSVVFSARARASGGVYLVGVHVEAAGVGDGADEVLEQARHVVLGQVARARHHRQQPLLVPVCAHTRVRHTHTTRHARYAWHDTHGTRTTRRCVSQRSAGIGRWACALCFELAKLLELGLELAVLGRLEDRLLIRLRRLAHHLKGLEREVAAGGVSTRTRTTAHAHA